MVKNKKRKKSWKPLFLLIPGKFIVSNIKLTCFTVEFKDKNHIVSESEGWIPRKAGVWHIKLSMG